MPRVFISWFSTSPDVLALTKYLLHVFHGDFLTLPPHTIYCCFQPLTKVASALSDKLHLPFLEGAPCEDEQVQDCVQFCSWETLSSIVPTQDETDPVFLVVVCDDNSMKTATVSLFERHCKAWKEEQCSTEEVKKYEEETISEPAAGQEIFISWDENLPNGSSLFQFLGSFIQRKAITSPPYTVFSYYPLLAEPANSLCEYYKLQLVETPPDQQQTYAIHFCPWTSFENSIGQQDDTNPVFLRVVSAGNIVESITVSDLQMSAAEANPPSESLESKAEIEGGEEEFEREIIVSWNRQQENPEMLSRYVLTLIQESHSSSPPILIQCENNTFRASADALCAAAKTDDGSEAMKSVFAIEDKEGCFALVLCGPTADPRRYSHYDAYFDSLKSSVVVPVSPSALSIVKSAKLIPKIQKQIFKVLATWNSRPVDIRAYTEYISHLIKSAKIEKLDLLQCSNSVLEPVAMSLLQEITVIATSRDAVSSPIEFLAFQAKKFCGVYLCAVDEFADALAKEESLHVSSADCWLILQKGVSSSAIKYSDVERLCPREDSPLPIVVDEPSHIDSIPKAPIEPHSGSKPRRSYKAVTAPKNSCVREVLVSWGRPDDPNMNDFAAFVYKLTCDTDPVSPDIVIECEETKLGQAAVILSELIKTKPVHEYRRAKGRVYLVTFCSWETLEYELSQLQPSTEDCFCIVKAAEIKRWRYSQFEEGYPHTPRHHSRMSARPRTSKRRKEMQVYKILGTWDDRQLNEDEYVERVRTLINELGFPELDFVKCTSRRLQSIASRLSTDLSPKSGSSSPEMTTSDFLKWEDAPHSCIYLCDPEEFAVACQHIPKVATAHDHCWLLFQKGINRDVLKYSEADRIAILKQPVLFESEEPQMHTPQIQSHKRPTSKRKVIRSAQPQIMISIANHRKTSEKYIETVQIEMSAFTDGRYSKPILSDSSAETESFATFASQKVIQLLSEFDAKISSQCETEATVMSNKANEDVAFMNTAGRLVKSGFDQLCTAGIISELQNLHSHFYRFNESFQGRDIAQMISDLEQHETALINLLANVQLPQIHEVRMMLGRLNDSLYLVMLLKRWEIGVTPICGYFVTTPPVHVTPSNYVYLGASVTFIPIEVTTETEYFLEVKTYEGVPLTKSGLTVSWDSYQSLENLEWQGESMDEFKMKQMEVWNQMNGN